MKSLRFKTFKEFYQTIPPEGSLGILAMGASAVAAWRNKRRELGLPRAASFMPEQGAAAKDGNEKTGV